MNRELATAARRFADANTARIAEVPSERLIVATVTDVAAGAAPDGNALVTVTWRGSPCSVSGYLASYTPAEGHRVVCAYIDNQLIITGRVIGQP